MKEEIKIAEEIYLNSVSVETGFAPMSFQSLVYALDAKGIKSSTSTLQRWCEKYGWREKAKNIARNLSSSSVAKNIATKKSLDAIKNIEEIVPESSAYLLEYVRDVAARRSKNPKEVELVLKIMTASAMLITKPLEKPTDDRIDAVQLLEMLRKKDDSDLIEGEIEEQEQDRL